MWQECSRLQTLFQDYIVFFVFLICLYHKQIEVTLKYLSNIVNIELTMADLAVHDILTTFLQKDKV